VEIGFIGLGNMGFPMARRLVQANHDVVAFDTNSAALEGIVGLGAHTAGSPKEVADRTETSWPACRRRSRRLTWQPATQV